MAQTSSPQPPDAAAPSPGPAAPTSSSIAAAMGGGTAAPTAQAAPRPAEPRVDPSVDVEAIESVASSLLPLAADARDAASGVMRHAPDPGTAPAPDAVVDVQGSAIDAFSALSTAFEESSALLLLSARRYRDTEDEVARAVGRVGEDRP